MLTFGNMRECGCDVKRRLEAEKLSQKARIAKDLEISARRVRTADVGPAEPLSDLVVWPRGGAVRQGNSERIILGSSDFGEFRVGAVAGGLNGTEIAASYR